MKPSPEERLLRLIRGKPQPVAGAAAAPRAAEPAGVVVISGTAARRPAMRWPMIAGTALGALLIGEVLVLVFALSRPQPHVTVPELPDVTSVDPSGEGPTPLEIPSLQASASPSLFQSPLAGGSTTSTGPVQRTGPSDLAKSLAARLTLTGIMDGEPPQAVIEDSETKKTHFVSPGQAVAEGAVLAEVLNNRVILDLNGEKIDLSL